MSFSETTTTVIEGVTSMQKQFMELQERVRKYESRISELEELVADYQSEIMEKTDLLESLAESNEVQITELHYLRGEIRKLRRRPDGMKVSGSVHFQQTRSNQRNQSPHRHKKNNNSPKRNNSPKKKNNSSRKNNSPKPAPTPTQSSPDTSDNIPAGFEFTEIPPEVAEQLINIIRQNRASSK
jgi:chromosome segregation ATPase